MMMMRELKTSELARLHAKFVLPVVVSRMLGGQEELDEVAEQAMHEILDEHRPDAALLCIAMCAQHVAIETSHLGISSALSREATKIIEDYAPVWLAYEDVKAGRIPEDEFDDQAIYELLEHVPEDLESLSDLLDATIAELNEAMPIPAILAHILSEQAMIQQLRAEIELDNIHTYTQDIPVQGELELAGTAQTGADGFAGNNVVMFPGTHKATFN